MAGTLWNLIVRNVREARILCELYSQPKRGWAVLKSNAQWSQIKHNFKSYKCKPKLAKELEIKQFFDDKNINFN